MKHSETCKHFNGFFERLFILLIKKTVPYLRTGDGWFRACGAQ